MMVGWLVVLGRNNDKSEVLTTPKRTYDQVIFYIGLKITVV